MNTTSYWLDSSTLPESTPLSNDLEVDVIVVGAGITGITAAYLLKRAGRTVALVERERCVRIDTAHTTAHITAVTDLGITELVDTFGVDCARAVWDSGVAAIDQIVKLIRAEDIDCDFLWVPGYTHAALEDSSESDAKELRKLAESAAQIGVRAEYRDSIPYFDLPGVKFSRQALFHPRKYLAALLHKIPGNGSHVLENTAVDEVEDEPLVVKANGHSIRGKYLILATHTPLTGKAGLLKATAFQSKLALYTTYALGAKIPSGLIPHASYWDLSDPYYYLRVEPKDGYDYAIFGGEDHKTGQEENTHEPYASLEECFLKHVPQAQIDHRWSGQVIETNDGLPFIGEFTKDQFISTGYAGNGMTFGTLGGMMALDAALGRPNPWTKLYDPHRKKLVGGTWKYITENKDYPYYLVRDWLGGAEAKTLDAVKPGEGKILNLDGKKVAAHRNAAGEISLCSPVCTHLQCIVGWNNAEQTWDCPCHGSRFKPTGEVISGPAEEPLEKIPAPAEIGK
jgi:glycine/D-amino acid oxidase-like deaminating enzyme/nitrite reductase/ring-hydroxylating ferredoxin subunit